MSDRMAEGFGPVDNRMRWLGTSVRGVRLRRECRDSIEVVASNRKCRDESSRASRESQCIEVTGEWIERPRKMKIDSGFRV
jgi:hypothetical protein